MTVDILLNLLNELRKDINVRLCRVFDNFFATSLIKSMIHEHTC